MDDQNKDMKERWAPTPQPRERGRANEPERSSDEYATDFTEKSDDTETRARELRSEIDRTRGDMSETIDAIQDRLNPRNVVSRAADNVREATIGKARQMAHHVQDRLPSFADDHSNGGILNRIKDNPVAAAIAAGAVAWIAFGGRRSPSHKFGRAMYGSTRGGQAYLRETRIDTSADADQSSEWSQSVDEWSDEARASMRRAGTQMRAATRQARHMADESPFATAAIAAAMGLAIGLAIPETEREDELMGEAKEALIERGRETVREAAGRVQDAAAQVQRVAGEVLTGAAPQDRENRKEP
jgi:ElaB/YqjD/DUF883 family membrane-anchored ribosome-binding protein